VPGLLALAIVLANAPVLAVSCDPGSIAAHASFSGIIRPAMAEDVDPTADRVEVFLTAREAVVDFGTGNNTAVFTYNGVIPGPTIEANVGDTLVVHLCNDLPVDTTIHWHGLETPANMDGSNIAQLAVPPGGTFTYEFPLLVAGTFWYHPHIQTNVQVEKGLYGALIVHDPVADAALGLPLPASQHIIVLDDILLDSNGQVPAPFVGTKEDVALEELNGREGNTPLFNGVSVPDITLEQGVPQRARILNVANARFMRMSIPSTPLWRIGGDQGLLEHALFVEPAADPTDPTANRSGPLPEHSSDPDPTTGLLLSPAERADVVFVPWAANSPDPFVRFDWHDTPRGRHSVDFLPDGTVVLAHNVPDGTQLAVVWAEIYRTGVPGATSWTPPDPLRTIAAIDTTNAPVLPLVLGHTMPNWDTGQVTFFVQAMGKPFAVLDSNDVHTVNENGTYIWEVKNLTGGSHNFHTHGWSFQPIETEYVDLDTPGNNRIEPAAFLENKDTFVLKARPGLEPMRSWTIGRFAVKFSDTGREGQVEAGGKTPTAETSGGWLAHCHILEHADRGMMTFFQVALFADGFESVDTSGWSLALP